jgi:hypothetical protein
MPDSFTETKSESDGGLIGTILAPIVGLILLWVGITDCWNHEQAALKHEQALNDGSHVVAMLTSSNAPKFENHLVHYSSNAVTTTTPVDPDTGVSAKCIRLSRKVEMFQWVESKETYTTRHRETTTWNYEKRWQEGRIDSGQFQHPTDHENPSLPLASRNFDASTHLGDYVVPGKLIELLSPSSVLDVTKLYKHNSLALKTKLPVKAVAQAIYIGKKPDSPAVGDVRISYMTVPVQSLTVVAKKTHNTFAPFTTHDGETVYLIQPGSIAVKTMFDKAVQAVEHDVWMKRGLSWFTIGMAFFLILLPFTELAEIVPVLGDMFTDLSLVACAVLGLIVTGVIMVATWITYNALFAGIVFGSACALGSGIYFTNKARREYLPQLTHKSNRLRNQ